MDALNSNQVLSFHVKRLNLDVAEKMGGECVFVNCPMHSPLDGAFRSVIEALCEDCDSRPSHLIVMLETGGGYMETVERLVAVMRKHYERVSFVVPDYAYSAGTVLALSGDAIWMDYYSVLGPIDPQYPGQDGKVLPGTGYLTKFNELLKSINEKGAANASAELSYLVAKFDPAYLYHIEESIEHGVSLIKDWLPKYKFRHWNQTENGKIPVADDMKTKRAEDIARSLGEASRWHSHGRGISMEALEGIKLKIDDFGADKDLGAAIRNYHGLAVDFYTRTNRCYGYIHSRNGLTAVL